GIHADADAHRLRGKGTVKKAAPERGRELEGVQARRAEHRIVKTFPRGIQHLEGNPYGVGPRAPQGAHAQEQQAHGPSPDRDTGPRWAESHHNPANKAASGAT